MDLSLYQLRTFRDVARLNSFTKAAQRLGYSQSSVTSHVRALETRLGVQLFHRLSRGVQLTPAGETFHSYVEQIFAVVDEMTTALRPDGEISGRLTLGVSSTLIDHYAGRLIRECQLRLPRLHVSPRVLSTADVIAALASGSIDLGIILTTDTATDGDIYEVRRAPRQQPTFDISSRVLFGVDYLPVGAIGRDTTDLARATPNGMVTAGEQLVLVDESCPSQQALIGAMHQRHGVPSRVVETGSVEGAVDAVRSGYGVAMLPWLAVERHLECGHVEVRQDLPTLHFTARMIWSRQNGGPLRPARALLDMLDASSPQDWVAGNARIPQVAGR